jgi:23S rRNA G2445 N2-methylase RlmL
LRAVYTDAFDFIVTDPPYGVRQGKRTSLRALYGSLLRSFEQVLAPAGRIVLVVLKRGAFDAALRETGLLAVHERRLEAGRLAPWMVVLSHRRDGEARDGLDSPVPVNVP